MIYFQMQMTTARKVTVDKTPSVWTIKPVNARVATQEPLTIGADVKRILVPVIHVDSIVKAFPSVSLLKTMGSDAPVQRGLTTCLPPTTLYLVFSIRAH